jgi:hypothetical protein
MPKTQVFLPVLPPHDSTTVTVDCQTHPLTVDDLLYLIEKLASHEKTYLYNQLGLQENATISSSDKPSNRDLNFLGSSQLMTATVESEPYLSAFVMGLAGYPTSFPMLQIPNLCQIAKSIEMLDDTVDVSGVEC